LRAHHVHVEHDFAKPVDRVFAHLSEHENLSSLFGAKVTRLCDGEDGHRNGVGSRRSLRIAVLPPFEETVTEFVPDERIVYRITKGSPLRNHEGVMEFAARPGGGSHVDYRIRLASPVPGLARVVKTSLTRTIRAGLAKADRAA
jgi:uncharacterized protein YndB with AHSA1/START domain